MKVPLITEFVSRGESPDVLFWVGCAGSFDQRAQKITKAFVKILNHLDIKFAVFVLQYQRLGGHFHWEGFPKKENL